MLSNLASSVAFAMASAIQSPSIFISSIAIPRLVIAGVPMRMPLGSKGVLGSNGTLFALQTMPARSSAEAASFPEMSLLVKSMRMR